MKAVQVDWSDWSFGPGRHPVIGAAMAGLTALSVTAAGEASGVLPDGWPVIAGTVLGFAAAITGAWKAAPGPAVAYRGLCWVAAGGWSSATLTWSTPWSRWPLILLATGVALAAVVGQGLAWLEQRQKPAEPTPVPERGRDPVAARWETRLRQITRRQIVVDRAERWDPPTGFTLHCTLPADGTTVADVKAYETQLAHAANLPVGCNVEVLPPDRSRRPFLIRVATQNAMVETRHLGSGEKGAMQPQDVARRSIADGLWVANYADRTKAMINLRYTCGVLVGQTGSGKTNMLNVITHRVGQCVDALAWAIDLSGNGKYPRPWIRAWYEQRAEAPVIDWAAVTIEDAELLCLAAINVINGRTGAYQQLMFEANDDKVPVSPDVPGIVIFVDEFGTLPEPIKELLRTISDTGRSSGVRVMSCALEAKGAYIPREMITQARERIAMRVSDEAQLQYLFDAVWSRGRFDPAMIPYEGSGLLATGAAAPLPAKALREEPTQIDAASVALARLRPHLDDVSQRLADAVGHQRRDDYGQWVSEQATGVYTQRWERTLPLMFPGPGRARPVSQHAAAGGTATLIRPHTEEETVDLESSAERLRKSVEAARAAREQAEAEQVADWTVVEGWLAEPGPAGERVPPRVRVRQVVEQHRRDGIGPRAVWHQLREEGYGTAEQTVITWMRADAAAGILAQPGGKGQPYVPGPDFTLER